MTNVWDYKWLYKNTRKLHFLLGLGHHPKLCFWMIIHISGVNKKEIFCPPGFTPLCIISTTTLTLLYCSAVLS